LQAQAGCCALFLCGWVLTRGANAQKFACKVGRRSFLWGAVPMVTLPGSKGRILVSGWWGVSRHFHYLPEITAALCWSATAGATHVLPYFYVTFLTILLLDRGELKGQAGWGWGAPVPGVGVFLPAPSFPHTPRLPHHHPAPQLTAMTSAAARSMASTGMPTASWCRIRLFLGCSRQVV
jgi:hypothetical protein